MRVVRTAFAAALLLCLGQQATHAQSATPAVDGANAQAGAAFRIAGVVVDAMSGQPLTRAQVAITPDAARDAGRVEYTDENGRFVFEQVAPGKHVLSARRRGYVGQMYQQHESFTTAIVTGPELDSEHLRFELRPGASISGTVVDEANDPVRHADVRLFRQTTFAGKRRTLLVRTANSDDEGHYRFGHLNPGTFLVSVSAQPWYAQHFPLHQPRPEQSEVRRSGGLARFANAPDAPDTALDVAYPVTFFPNANDIAGAGTITVQAGDSEIADFTLRPVPALHVLIRTTPDAENQGINADLSVNAGENGTIPIPAMGSQVEPGVIELMGVPPGNLNVGVGQSKGSEWAHHTQSVQVSGDMEINDGEHGGLGVISGVVRVDDGTTVPGGARVVLRGEARGENAETEVMANGEFSFKNNPVGPGSYELMISNAPGFLVRGLNSPNVKTVGRSFEIVNARDLNITMTVARANGRVRGVALKDGKPMGGAMIVLVPQDLRANPALFRRDQSDSDGTFLLGALVTGKYTVVAIENGWSLEWSNPDVMKRYLAGGEEVQIVANGKVETKVNVQ
jgi:Carboxypeptidase regulatory-like domain